jgi:hypothetical protein
MIATEFNSRYEKNDSLSGTRTDGASFCGLCIGTLWYGDFFGLKSTLPKAAGNVLPDGSASQPSKEFYPLDFAHYTKVVVTAFGNFDRHPGRPTHAPVAGMEG